MRGAALLTALALAGCGASDGPAPQGVLSVERAREVEGEEPLSVRGWLFLDTDGRMRLCDAIAESYPPQCGGAELAVEGLRMRELPPLERAQGVAWSREQATLRGLVVDGTLRVVAGTG